MTIYLYSGTVGSSKSLHAANEIRFALNRPSQRPVIGNFELSPTAPVRSRDNYTYLPNSELTAQSLIDYAEEYWTSRDFFKEDYITLIIDEAQLLFNSRCWTQKDRMEFLEFFSQSRKYGYKVIFIAQSAKMIDNQFRMLVEYEINHRRVSSMGVIGWLLSLLFGGNKLFCWVEYLFQTNERLGASWYLAKRKDFAMYDSFKKFEKKQ